MASSRSDDLVPPDTPETPDGGGFPLTRRDALATGAAAAAAVPLMRAGGAAAQSEATRPPLRQGAVAVRATINGEPVELEVDPRSSLLDVLRETLALTGAKKGCDHGQCGACTVMADGRRINACLSLAVMHDGGKVTTIEGLGTPSSLHPMQAAFVKHDGYQCGYCTPGQICSAVAVLDEIRQGIPSHVSADLNARPQMNVVEFRERMSGNICRCGAYANIADAMSEVAGRQA